MRQKISSIARALRLPSLCVLCKHYHQSPLAVCIPCSQLLSPISACCHYCALPLPESSFMICGLCVKKKPFFDRTVASYHFTEPLRTLLHNFKYREGLYLTSFIAELMLQTMPETLVRSQCLVPVPIHPQRLRQRGFNQALELSKYLGTKLQLPYDYSFCRKIKNTAAQAELNGKQRKANLKGAFQADPSPYQHITIVDDLMTTGSTVNEIARVLKLQGVKRVDVWCCARVNKPN